MVLFAYIRQDTTSNFDGIKEDDKLGSNCHMFQFPHTLPTYNQTPESYLCYCILVTKIIFL